MKDSISIDWYLGREPGLFSILLFREHHLKPQRVFTIDIVVLSLHLMVSAWLPGKDVSS